LEKIQLCDGTCSYREKGRRKTEQRGVWLSAIETVIVYRERFISTRET